jgi:excisionase family DNA binding protein
MANRQGDQRLLSVADACDALGVGRTTIYALLKSGELQRIKIGSRTLVSSYSISAFIDKKSSEPHGCNAEVDKQRRRHSPPVHKKRLKVRIRPLQA